MGIPDSFQQKYAFRFSAWLAYFSHNVFSAVRASPAKGPVSVFLSGAAPAAVLGFFNPYLFVFQEQHCK